MKHFNLIVLTIAIVYFSACKNTNTDMATQVSTNPLLTEFTTPYGVPPFDMIKNEHYKPAFEAAMQVHKAEVDSIANNTNAPDFANTIEALDDAGAMLTRISGIFFNMTGANTNDTLEKISEEIAPTLSKHYDYISMNDKLFAKVKQVYDKRTSLGLNEEQSELLDKTYKSFIRNGALLNKEQKQSISKINEELALLTLKFGQNTLAEVNDFKLIVDNKDELKGLSDDLIAAAAETAKENKMEGKWVFTLQNPSVMPFLQYAENKALRDKIWKAMQNKGNNQNANDNNEIVKKIASLRLQRANLLGYATHAHYVLEEQMAQNPDNVNKLLNDLWKPAITKAKVEAAEIQEYIKSEGGDFKVSPSDWRYYSEKIRKQKFDLDENEIKQYFSLGNVHQGVFGTVGKLYGIQFKERKDLPIYHPEVKVYEVNEADGSLIGILYMDFHPRASKRSGAWMTSFSDQKMKDGKRVPPVISIVCNFSKPTGDSPSLLTYDEVSTYFHEFGHALHGLLSNVNYNGLAGTNVPTDFVELPSQIMENWAAEPEVLKSFAKHYKTGEVMPDALIDKIKKAGTYGQGFATTEYLAASILDMDYHTQKSVMETSAQDFEKKSMISHGLIDEIIPRYRSTYFNHIFSGGYSSGYYSYIWSEVLDSDAFEAFKQKGLFDQATALAFRKNILEKGGTADPMELYKRFRGADPTIDPLLKKRGLN
jgi:peptidyl-dipeptidase Dcp